MTKSAGKKITGTLITLSKLKINKIIAAKKQILPAAVSNFAEFRFIQNYKSEKRRLKNKASELLPERFQN